MKNTIIARAAAGTLAAALPSPAQAHCVGCGVAAGVVGGLAAGAIIGSAMARPYGYGYYGPGPYYAYGPRCFWTRQRVWDGYGWRLARVRVCD